MSSATIDYFRFITLFGYGAAGATITTLFLTFSTRDKAFYLLLVNVAESVYN